MKECGEGNSNSEHVWEYIFLLNWYGYILLHRKYAVTTTTAMVVTLHKPTHNRNWVSFVFFMHESFVYRCWYIFQKKIIRRAHTHTHSRQIFRIFEHLLYECLCVYVLPSYVAHVCIFVLKTEFSSLAKIFLYFFSSSIKWITSCKIRAYKKFQSLDSMLIFQLLDDE